jgi:hypothetical protein
MPVAPSFQDLLAQAQAEVLARNPKYKLREGDIADLLLRGGGAMADVAIRFAAQGVRDNFLDGASGDALTELVNDRYQIQRKAATFAQVTVEFTRATSLTAGTIDAGTRIATAFDATGRRVTFTLDGAVAVGIGELGPFEASATADVSGPDGNADAGTIVVVLDTLFDTFTVTNPLTAGGGQVRETDEQLRARARASRRNLRRGTIEALETGALTVASVSVAVVEEDEVFNVSILVSDADGNSTAQMIADVDAELENWRCAGIPVTVVGGVRSVVDVTATFQVRGGFDIMAREPDLQAAFAARVGRLRAGQTLFLDMLVHSLIDIAPDDIFEVAFTAITVDGVTQAIGDIEPSLGQVLRPGTLTIG